MATVTNERGGKQSRIEARFTSLPPNALKLVAECFGFGAAKYGDENWHNISAREHLDHLLNHANEFRRGDRSEMHLVNLTVRALMALEMAVREESHPVCYSHPDMEAGDGSGDGGKIPHNHNPNECPCNLCHEWRVLYRTKDPLPRREPTLQATPH